jgi:hypothetical protein
VRRPPDRAIDTRPPMREAMPSRGVRRS